MRIPAHLQQISQELALRSWVRSSSFPRETYFASVDIFKARIAIHQPDGDDPADSYELVAAMIGAAVNAEGALLTHALKNATCNIDGPDRWSRICLAAGWAVLQSYEHACNNGEWNHEH
ncbi:MAG TPA: hypothetical protein VFN92_02600 [Solirubrobacterales bacterium]|nr:hypothetical protein [Solirubrobacterales bacterium]